MSRIILKNSKTKVFSQLINKNVISITEVNLGIINYVYQVIARDGSSYFIKQALKETKNKNILNMNFVKDRIGSEYKSLHVLNNLREQNNQYLLPEIVLYDKLNMILVTKDLKPTGNLQQALKKGTFDIKIAKNIGVYLAHQHSKTYNKVIIIGEDQNNDIKEWNFFLSLRTKDLLKNHSLADLKKELIDIYEKGSSNASHLLMHLDYCPKNILFFNDKRIAVLDFEFSSGIGDPAYDIGFIIGHYLLFAIVFSESGSAIDSIFELYDAYCKGVEKLSFYKEFGERIWKYVGCTLLYRTIGASPDNSINQTQKNKIIKAGKELLKMENINKYSIQELIK
jgi:5-methylthioribose kinase